jgi:hypothetical protein
MHSTATLPAWSTASEGEDAHTRPAELQALGQHLGDCRAASGRLFALQCGGEAMHGFLATRLMTTVLVFASVIGVVVVAWVH